MLGRDAVGSCDSHDHRRLPCHRYSLKTRGEPG